MQYTSPGNILLIANKEDRLIPEIDRQQQEVEK